MEPLVPGDPTQVGAYRLIGRVGAGGMGQVFLGISRGGRKVAVKVLRADLVADPEFRARFAREVAAARTVNGFYTAPVVDADPGASPPWMVTAYVDGPSLAAAVAQHGPLGDHEVRDLAAALAEGLAAIHEGGLVHRDLKPANIILANDGPRIIDFGIAHAVGMTTMTTAGTIIGTFTYMSPEQITGLPAGSPSDVFSLGSVLVFAATGHGPFDAKTLPAISHRITTQPPDFAGLPETLTDLLTRCLEKEPSERPSLDELLTRLGDPGTQPQAQVPPHSGPVLGPASAWQPALGPAPAPLPAWRPAAFRPAQSPEPAPGTPVFGSSAPPAYPSNPPPPSELMSAAGWNVREIAFSPDGRLIAGSAERGAQWKVLLWDTQARELAAPSVASPGQTPPRIAFSPDGRLLIVKEPASTRLLDVATRQFVSLRGTAREQSWKKVRFSPDGRLVATVSESRRVSGFTGTRIHLWDGATLQPIGGPIKVDYLPGDSTLAFSPDSRYLLFGHGGQVLLGDVTAPQPALRKLKDLRGTLGRTSFSGDGRMVAAQCPDGKAVRVLGTAAQTPVATVNCVREITRIEFSPDGLLLATAMVSTGSEAIDLWDLAPTDTPSWPEPSDSQYSARRVGLRGFQLPVNDLRFSPRSEYLAAASRASRRDSATLLQVWATNTAEPASPLSLPGPVRMTFSPDSRFLAASCPDRAVRLVNMQTAGQVSVLPGANATFSPTAQLLATTEPTGLRLWALP